MGSDLGHEKDTSNQLFNSKKWSRKEKEVIRLLLSNNTGSVLLCILIELMIYNYTVYYKIILVYSIEFDFASSYKKKRCWKSIILCN